MTTLAFLLACRLALPATAPAAELDWERHAPEALGIEVRPDIGRKPWTATTVKQYCRLAGKTPAQPNSYSVTPGSNCESNYERVEFRVPGPGGAPRANYILHVYFDDSASGTRANQPVVLLAPLPYPNMMKILCQDIARLGLLCGTLEIPNDPTWSFDPGKPFESIDNVRGGLSTAVRVGGFCLDYLLSRPEADPRHAGVFGISLGGVTASLWAQRNPRVRSVVLFLSGAGLADILAKNRDEQVLRFTAELRARAGLGDEEAVRGFLEKELESVEPLRGVERMRGLSVFMINPIDDPFVPEGVPERYAAEMLRHGATVTSVRLPFRAHNPLHILWNIPAIVRTTAALRASMRFLQETLR